MFYFLEDAFESPHNGPDHFSPTISLFNLFTVWISFPALIVNSSEVVFLLASSYVGLGTLDQLIGRIWCPLAWLLVILECPDL